MIRKIVIRELNNLEERKYVRRERAEKERKEKEKKEKEEEALENSISQSVTISKFGSPAKGGFNAN